MNRLLGTAPIDVTVWLKIVAAAIVTWLVVEAEKSLRRRASRRRVDARRPSRAIRGTV